MAALLPCLRQGCMASVFKEMSRYGSAWAGLKTCRSSSFRPRGVWSKEKYETPAGSKAGSLDWHRLAEPEEVTSRLWLRHSQGPGLVGTRSWKSSRQLALASY